MKQLWCVLSIVTSSLLFTANASAKENSSEALLQEMNKASQSLNYELSFISVNKQGIESQRYRHIRLNNYILAQLLQMDGPFGKWFSVATKLAILNQDSNLLP